MSNSVWTVAGRLLARHLDSGARLDLLLEKGADQLSPVDRRRCRHLLYGAVRHLGLLEFALDQHLRSRPRALLRAALLLGAFELLEHPEEAPSIVHHAVAQTRELASASEARVVNAVLRRAAATLAEATAADGPPTPADKAAAVAVGGTPAAGADAAALARRFSHPTWLIERWLARFGAEATRQFLVWNQQPAPVHARIVTAGEGAAPSDAKAADLGATLPEFLKPTRWPGFFLLERPDWEIVERWIAAGRIYLQDPATAVAPNLLGAAPGETVLDLCASPGGKTLHLAGAVCAPVAVGAGAADARPASAGRVVAVDLPGPRLERLRENVARHPALAAHVSIVGRDGNALTRGALEALKLPTAFDAALVDVPCSNTGVLRHRVEVKWRLRPEDFVELPALQLGLLRRAAALVRPGGRLVYSTCSLEPEENEGVIERFLAAPAHEGASKPAVFALERAERSRPWETGCDGAAAFLLRRIG